MSYVTVHILTKECRSKQAIKCEHICRRHGLSHVYQSRHTYEWVMSHINDAFICDKMSRVTHSYVTKWVVLRIHMWQNESCYAFICDKMSRVTHSYVTKWVVSMTHSYLTKWIVCAVWIIGIHQWRIHMWQNESWVMSHIKDAFICDTTHSVSSSPRAYPQTSWSVSVMSHIDESCHTRMSDVTYECDMS